MVLTTTQIWGNLVSFYVLSTSTNDASTSPMNISDMEYKNTSFENFTCGADFCGGVTHSLPSVSDDKRHILTGIFCALSIMSASLVAIFLDSLKYKEQKVKSENEVVMKLLATLKQMIKVDQLFLSLLTIFHGLGQGFVSGDYSKAYVACALGLENVGLVFVCFGVVSSVTSICAGHIIKFVPRWAIITTAALNHAGLLLALYTWNSDNPKISYFIIAGFWAFSGAIWQTQLCALHGTMFRSNEEAAYANQELFRALGFVIAFGCSSLLCTSSKIYVLAGFLLSGMAGYFAVEVRMRRKKLYTITKTEYKSDDASENLNPI